jgi:hypothetical protein
VRVSLYSPVNFPFWRVRLVASQQLMTEAPVAHSTIHCFTNTTKPFAGMLAANWLPCEEIVPPKLPMF